MEAGLAGWVWGRLTGCCQSREGLTSALFIKLNGKVFAIVDVPEGSPDVTEPLGTKYKFWFSDNPRGRCLFKEGRPNTGDDWSEKVACELCELLGVPHAQYELGIYKGRRGVISPTFVPEDGGLIHGNELLSKIVTEYPEKRFFRVREHTLSRVVALLTYLNIGTPYESESFPGVETAFDFFVGYLMLDAWIANQDRHHENWGLLAVPPDYTIHLAPSYYHASCLGANETDENRSVRLRTRDVGRSMEKYVTRAKSAFYPSRLDPAAKPMSPLEAFRQAGKRRPTAALAWLERLNRIYSSDVQSIFSRIPDSRITNHGIRFATKLLEINQYRLADLAGGFR